MVRISDVAARARVAPSVVSRFLNHDPSLRIRDTTRERITAAIAELRYVPNSAARNLRTATSGALGILVPNVTSPIYSEILRGAEHAGDQLGYALFLANFEDPIEHTSRYERLVQGKRVDGLLLQPTATVQGERLAMIASSIPTILVNSRLENHQGSVVLDDTAGVMLAMRHLLQLGHQRIAHLGGPALLDTSQRRRTAYEQALGEQHLAREAWRVVMGNGVSEHDAIDEILKQKPLPTAIFVWSVMSAVIALTYLHEKGVRVPDDLSIVALHDTWFARHTRPPLTTVQLPLYDMGVRAVERLVQTLKGDQPSDITIRNPEPVLCVRESTAAPRD